MNGKNFCCGALLLFATGAMGAQQLEFDPPNPTPEKQVAVTYPVYPACPAIPILMKIQPPGNANGQIELAAAVNPCGAPPSSFKTLTVSVGKLPLGTYDVKAFTGAAPIEGILTVSRNGEVVALRPEPARPAAGQTVSVAFQTYCPHLWQAPRLPAAGEETLIIVDENPEAPQPAAPCTSQPTYGVQLHAGPLSDGNYRLQVRMGPDLAHLEIMAESVFTVAPAGPVLSLRQGRFDIRANWNAPGFGQGSAQAVQLTDESGYFTFFDPNNVELIVKALNGCPVNQRYWVFMAGLTNVGVTIFVEDTLTGHQETYSNPMGRPFQPILDTAKFATCP